MLGIGLRLAGRAAGQVIMGETAQGTGPTQRAATAAGTTRTERVAGHARAAGQASRGVVRGLGGFFKPFRSVGGKIWLEVSGVFFLLPVVVFAPVLWRTRASWQQGPDHRTFLSAAIIIAVFLYLGVSSFWRAARRR